MRDISVVSMSAQRIASTFFKSVVTKGGRDLDVRTITETSAWFRPSNFPVESVKEEFAKLVEEQGDKLKDGVAIAALK